MARLAIEGGPKMVKTLGPYTSKMHIEELLHVMDLWQYGPGEFGSDLRSFIISLKYSAGTSEPKIRELLENFRVQISSGSISNILTGSEAFQVATCIRTGTGACGKLGTTWLLKNAPEAGAK